MNGKAPRLWHPQRVRALWLLCLLAACRDGSTKPTPADIVDRGWRAHEVVIRAGEREPTCAAAGIAMQRAFTEHRQAFVDAIALDSDRARLAEATAYLEQHERRYGDLETRMTALSERCGDEPTVAAVYRWMESP